MRVSKITRHAKSKAVVRLVGRDCYLGPYDSEETRRAYAMLIAEYLGNKHSFSSGNDKKSTLDELGAAFLSYSKETYSDAEYDNIRQAVSSLIELYADLPAKDFGPRQFKAFHTQFQAGWQVQSFATVHQQVDAAHRTHVFVVHG